MRDALGLVFALGYREVASVVGHDFGSPVAAWCALVRPDVFRSVGLMSAPFPGPPSVPFDTWRNSGSISKRSGFSDLQDSLAKLNPPRKHYQSYYSTRQANADIWHCPQGVHAFLRAYFHMKSADWAANKPFRLAASTAEEFTKLPRYYAMDLDKDMAATVAPEMPAPEFIAACEWLPDRELSVYSTEYERTGFQGGLNWYRCRTTAAYDGELEIFSGRTIDVPSMFIAGASDWGVYQFPGALERMQREACTRMLGCHLVEGAGHWVQQEQPDRVIDLLLQFLAR